MDAVMYFGAGLIDDPGRYGTVNAPGLDETLFCRQGRWRTQCWSTQIVDVRRGQLLDVVPGRDAEPSCAWLAARPQQWRDQIRWATLDLSGPYRKVFDTMLPDAVQVADPFHVVKLAGSCVDEVRRRVQNDTCSHRGHKDDPLYRARRLLLMADERLSDHGKTKVLGLLEAGDPKGEVRDAWHAYQVVRHIYTIADADTGAAFVARLATALRDEAGPPEVPRLGRTFTKWQSQIAAWHRSHVSNGPTEAIIIWSPDWREHQNPCPHPDRVRVPLTRRPHRPRHARPRRTLPTPTQPTSHLNPPTQGAQEPEKERSDLAARARPKRKLRTRAE